jgi:hypothetical protein
MANPHLPWFLRKGGNIPLHNLPASLPNVSRPRGDEVEWIAFELSVSVDTLLTIKDAPELLFDFLCQDTGIVVWMSEDSYFCRRLRSHAKDFICVVDSDSMNMD